MSSGIFVYLWRSNQQKQITMKCKQCAYALLDSVGKVYCTAKDETSNGRRATQLYDAMLHRQTEQASAPRAQHRHFDGATKCRRGEKAEYCCFPTLRQISNTYLAVRENLCTFAHRTTSIPDILLNSLLLRYFRGF